MAFAAPLWLLGLIPWAAFTLWVLAGRNRRETVPFLPLWNASAAKRNVSRRWEPPPIPLLFLLLAVLLALLGAARPMRRNALSAGITVIVDRGLTMSAVDHGVPRFVAAARRVASAINPSARVEIIDPIEHSHRITTGAGWVADIEATLRTGMDDHAATLDAAREALEQSAGEVVLLTDHAIGLASNRLLIVAPPSPLQDCGITAIAARGTPSPQVMITLRNHSTTVNRVVTITTAGETVSQTISIATDGEATAFINLRSLGDVIEAKLDGDEANQSAYLLRQGDQPRIEIRSPAVGEAVRRIANIYARQRPPTPNAPVIAVVLNEDDLRTDDGAIVSTGGGALDITTPKVVSDALTAIVDWNHLQTVTIASPPRGGGWTPIVSQGKQWLIARRESPARQVWIGFDQITWSQSPDFVVFWTNVFEWLTGDAQRWDAVPLRMLTPEWKRESPAPKGTEPNAWVGVYRTAAGERTAMNAKAIEFSELRSDAGDVQIPARAADEGLSRWVVIGAVGVTAFGLISWRGRDD